jgi:hypothetical protein
MTNGRFMKPAKVLMRREIGGLARNQGALEIKADPLGALVSDTNSKQESKPGEFDSASGPARTLPQAS